jgi:hypothetical protein
MQRYHYELHVQIRTHVPAVLVANDIAKRRPRQFGGATVNSRPITDPRPRDGLEGALM